MQLTDWQFRRLIEFEAFAADFGEDGLLPPVADMAWILRPVDETKLSEALMALSQVGEAEETPEGWRLTHFEKRQDKIPDAVRQRMSRMRHKDNTKRDEGVTGVVTDASTSSSDSLSDSVSVGIEGGGVGEGAVFAAYKNNSGMLTPMNADALKADIDDYTQDWVLAAIEYAVKQEKKSLAYVEGVLKGWKRD